MSRKSAHIVILCEDKRQWDFLRRFLEINGWNRRRLYPRISSGGSAEQFVREQFPIELHAYRSRKHNQSAALFVVTDADPQKKPADRISDFKKCCDKHDVEFRRDDEKVIFVIPKRNIETWFRYLNGEEFDEQTDYRNLVRQSNHFQFAKTLAEMCRINNLSPTPPPSLETACMEYERFK